MKYYVYVTDRGASNGYGYSSRVFANIYEAASKDDVKKLLLDDVDWLKSVRMRRTKDTPKDEMFITSIHEIDEYWEGVFLSERKCISCLNSFSKIDKLKYNTGGSSTFCSQECSDEYRSRLDPKATDTWDNGTVYKIVHKPSGKFYVGVTTRWVMQRWWEHIKADSGSKFHQFVKDSSITDFTFEILEQFRPSEVDPYEVEAKWINETKAVEIGLNSVNGHGVSK